jgi:hypothetical protein
MTQQELQKVETQLQIQNLKLDFLKDQIEQKGNSFKADENFEKEFKKFLD